MNILSATRQVAADVWAKPSFRHLLEETDRFVTAVELVTSRGLLTDREGQRVLAKARVLAESPRIDVLSITDNPAGNAMLAADTLGTDLMSHGQEVIIHLACKDCNRNSLQSRGWNLASEGFDNILALSGDYPSPGFNGMGRPSFDIDSVGLLAMYEAMNKGLYDERTGRQMQPTNFFLGAVVTNHKRLERELVPQYLKLRRKINTGARFIINQVGYNARKDDELLGWLRLNNLEVPVIANVYVLSRGAARAFNAGKIPGVVVTDELVALCEQQGASKDKGRSFFLEMAAKQVAIAKGLGFRGAYLGGKLRAVRLRGDPPRRRQVRPRGLERPRQGSPVRLPGRVLLLRARLGLRLVLKRGQPCLCRLAPRSVPGVAPGGKSQSATAQAASSTRPFSTPQHRFTRSPASSTPPWRLARARSRTCCT